MQLIIFQCSLYYLPILNIRKFIFPLDNFTFQPWTKCSKVFPIKSILYYTDTNIENVNNENYLCGITLCIDVDDVVLFENTKSSKIIWLFGIESKNRE